MNSIYLQLQSSSPSLIVPNSMFFTFDTDPVVTSDDVDDLQYVPAAGMIILQKPGAYLVEWNVSAMSPSEIKIALSTGTQGVIAGSSVGFPGQISGSAVVVVSETSAVTLQLMNQSGSTLTCSDVSVPVNLTIYAVVSDGTDDGGNSGGPGSGGDGGIGGSKVGKLLTLQYSSGSLACYPSLDATGTLTRVSAIGASESAIVPISSPVSGGTIFQLIYAVDKGQYVYSFPYKVRLLSISAVFNNRDAIMLNLPTTIISPFVGIAKQAIPDTYAFDIIEESETYPNPGYQMLAIPPQYIPNTKVMTAYKKDLNIEINAGEPFSIVGGLKNVGLSLQDLAIFIYMHGSMVFEILED